MPGEAVVCEDGQACVAGDCIVDLCFDVTCDDGETCEDGVCVLDLCADNTCDDESVCTEDSCDQATGDCVFDDVSDCADGEACDPVTHASHLAEAPYAGFLADRELLSAAASAGQKPK